MPPGAEPSTHTAMVSQGKFSGPIDRCPRCGGTTEITVRLYTNQPSVARHNASSCLARWFIEERRED